MDPLFRLDFSNSGYSNQRGFFAIMMVALTSFALWTTMSTIRVFSVNKSDSLAKFKEVNDIANILEDLAVEVEAAYYLYQKGNSGVCSNGKIPNCSGGSPGDPNRSCTFKDATICPENYKICTLDDGNKSKLCVRDYGHTKGAVTLSNADPTKGGHACTTCVGTHHGGGLGSSSLSSGRFILDSGYCARIDPFTNNSGAIIGDIFGDCNKESILCVTATINNYNSNTRKNPPKNHTRIEDCPTCFAQPFKVFLDPKPPDPPGFYPNEDCNKPPDTCAERLDLMPNKGCYWCPILSAKIDPIKSPHTPPTGYVATKPPAPYCPSKQAYAKKCGKTYWPVHGKTCQDKIADFKTLVISPPGMMHCFVCHSTCGDFVFDYAQTCMCNIDEHCGPCGKCNNSQECESDGGRATCQQCANRICQGNHSNCGCGGSCSGTDPQCGNLQVCDGNGDYCKKSSEECISDGTATGVHCVPKQGCKDTCFNNLECIKKCGSGSTCTTQADKCDACTGGTC